jgi:putative MATE family efflux protein
VPVLERLRAIRRSTASARATRPSGSSRSRAEWRTGRDRSGGRGLFGGPGSEIAAIAAPVSLEFVLTLVLNLVNQVVVGALGATAIAAVGFANSLLFVALFTLSALASSASILVARAHGGARRDEASTVVSIALLVTAALSTLVALPAFLWADDLLRLAGASQTVNAAGSDYFRLMALSTIPTVLSAVLSGILRSTGHARSPMITTLVTVAASTPLAYALVFGLGIFPRLGVAGAGWAALAVSVLKLGMLLAQTYRVHATVTWRWPGRIAAWRPVLLPLLVLAGPLAITQVAWTSGNFLYNVVLQRLGDEALAAAQIVGTVEAVFIVGSMGLMSAATVLIGQAVGRGDGLGAGAWVARVSRAGIKTGLVFGTLFAVSIVWLDDVFDDVGLAVLHLAALGIAINAAFQVVKVRNMILAAGVLPSGGDVRGVILGDVVGAFGVGLPLAVLLGLFTPLGIAGVFLARTVEELVKLAIFTARVGRVDWQTLARPFARP